MTKMMTMAESSDIEYTIRPLQAEDIPKLKQLTDKEDWGHNSEYLEFCRSMSRGSFLAAFGNDGEIISHCGATCITKDLAFIAFYVTRTEYRGKGIGKKVFNACMKLAGDINFGLNASASKQNMYVSGGFNISSFMTTGFIGTPIPHELSEMTSEDDIKIVDIGDIDFSSLLQYDDGIHIIPRHDFLKKWLARDNTIYRIAKHGEKIVGYGCMWPAASRNRVMPLYADSKSAALALWKEFCSKVGPVQVVEVLVPSGNAEAINFFRNTLNLIYPHFYDVRMFTKEDIKVNLDPVYSLCNFGINLV